LSMVFNSLSYAAPLRAARRRVLPTSWRRNSRHTSVPTILGAKTDGSGNPAPEAAARAEQVRADAAGYTEAATAERGSAMGRVAAARGAVTPANEVGIRACVRVNCPRFFRESGEKVSRELSPGRRWDSRRAVRSARRRDSGALPETTRSCWPGCHSIVIQFAVSVRRPRCLRVELLFWATDGIVHRGLGA